MSGRIVTKWTTVSKHTGEIVSAKVGRWDAERKICAIIEISRNCRHTFFASDDAEYASIAIQ